MSTPSPSPAPVLGFKIVSFGIYAYGFQSGMPNTCASIPNTIKDALTATLRISDTPGKDGGYTAGGLVAPRKLTLTVMLQADSLANLQTIEDSFKAVHSPGPPAQLLFANKRYINAEVESLDFEPWNGSPNKSVTVEFHAADPFYYAETTSGPQALALGANMVAVAGNRPSLPIITINVSSASGGSPITITDAAGNACTLAPASAGGFVIDSSQETVTNLADGSDAISIFDGVYPTLLTGSGAAALTVSTSGGITLGAMSVTWQNRWI